MSKKSSIPKKDVDFNVAQKIIVDTTSTNISTWNIDTMWFHEEIIGRQTIWDASWLAYENPATRTPTITFEKTEARKAFEKPLRKLVGGLQHNPNVTADDLRSMGIVIPSSARVPAPVADDSPDWDVDTSVIGRVGIGFFEKGSRHKKGKPDGQHGVEIGWMISDTPPARWEDLLHSSIDTNSPFTLSFENDQRGKTVYFALRWENTRGEKGPWSEIQSAIIP
jgi:hypothetical protein